MLRGGADIQGWRRSTCNKSKEAPHVAGARFRLSEDILRLAESMAHATTEPDSRSPTLVNFWLSVNSADWGVKGTRAACWLVGADCVRAPQRHQ